MAKTYNLNKFYSKIFNRYDLINKLFTFGLDRKWRRETVSSCVEEHPEKILDVCTGTGDLAVSIAKAVTYNAEVTGYDMNINMLGIAMQKANSEGLDNISFEQGDVGQMPFKDNTYDAITIGFGFRNLTFSNPDEKKHIGEICRVLKPGAKLIILESAAPENPFIRFFYKLHLFGFLVPVGGLLSGDFKAYWYLAHSSSKYYTSKELKALLEQNGFEKVSFKNFLFGATKLVIAKKKK